MPMLAIHYKLDYTWDMSSFYRLHKDRIDIGWRWICAHTGISE